MILLQYLKVEVLGPSGPQLLVGGPSGQLDFILRALRALRPSDPRNDVVNVRMVNVRVIWGKNCGIPTNEQGVSRSRIRNLKDYNKT